MRQFKIYLTPAQKDAVKALCKVRGIKQGQLIRDMLKRECERHGIVFEDTPKWGGKREGKKK